MTFQVFCVIVIIISLLFGTEFFIDRKENKHLYKKNETKNNILIGIGLFFLNFISKAIVLSAYYMVYSFRVFTPGTDWTMWVLVFILCDFTFYWYHRAAHEISWFWASHSVHHSSEHFNVSVSFRQSWTTQFSGHFIFYLWLPFIGFDPVIIYISTAIGLFYQSWLHTELIGKLHPVFEWIFNTPSHHRVHHASDIQYLDKNHGEVLIIWDRLFGTYQEEEEKPAYGLTKKLINPNVVDIMFSDWKLLFCKVSTAGSIKRAINYLIQPPGWSHDGSSKTVKELRKETKQLFIYKLTDISTNSLVQINK